VVLRKLANHQALIDSSKYICIGKRENYAGI
jgi:hypothetical protein